MIFSSTFNKVMDGTKTQTRRPVKNEKPPWETGKTYAVQPGRGKKSAGRLKVTKIRREKLIDISIVDCIAEGIETTPGEEEGAHVPEHRERFAELWNSLYAKTDYAWSMNPEVWVLEFELVEKS